MNYGFIDSLNYLQSMFDHFSARREKEQDYFSLIDVYMLLNQKNMCNISTMKKLILPDLIELLKYFKLTL